MEVVVRAVPGAPIGVGFMVQYPPVHLGRDLVRENCYFGNCHLEFDQQVSFPCLLASEVSTQVQHVVFQTVLFVRESLQQLTLLGLSVG